MDPQASCSRCESSLARRGRLRRHRILVFVIGILERSETPEIMATALGTSVTLHLLLLLLLLLIMHNSLLGMTATACSMHNSAPCPIPGWLILAWTLVTLETTLGMTHGTTRETIHAMIHAMIHGMTRAMTHATIPE
ncbi:hypothetical protein M406DRAFT_355915 [Cryphonectria parasitica EP155]|uniref:Uncharacterized protein n=1 Tax=Cryphonectria parasitica (strain ATCC 38755 / EP155) TaxID=660469 RepID=A0A9P4Y2R2_CRYP1|nr:uncharacterized protein M406DRAFT_355915 [Cryphonectria parasitica EP155]KAF3765428.1 hypothetical protein M406DRAFT_355915 [Cryphonectria parasitica EP155]